MAQTKAAMALLLHSRDSIAVSRASILSSRSLWSAMLVGSFADATVVG